MGLRTFGEDVMAILEVWSGIPALGVLAPYPG